MTAKAVLLFICFQTNINFSIRMSNIVLKTTNHLLLISYPSEDHGTIIGACTSMTTKINHFAENKPQPWCCCYFTINSSEIYQCLFAYRVKKGIFLLTICFSLYYLQKYSCPSRVKNKTEATAICKIKNNPFGEHSCMFHLRCIIITVYTKYCVYIYIYTEWMDPAYPRYNLLGPELYCPFQVLHDSL